MIRNARLAQTRMRITLSILTALIAFAATSGFSQDTIGSAAKSSGVDQSLFSDSVDPGDNFYLYANQKWLETTEIPGDKSNYGIFTVLDDQKREQVRALIEEAAESTAKPGTPAQKVGDLYRSVLNEDMRTDAGIQPISDMMSKLDAVKTRSELASLMGELTRSGIYSPLAPYVGVDAKDSQSYVVYLTQAGLTLPDRDYYLDDDQRYVDLRVALQEYISAMLGEAGGDPADALDVFEIEKAIAGAHWTKTENRDPDKTYNAKTSDEMSELLGGMDWRAFASAAGIGDQDKFVVRQPSFAEFFGNLMTYRSLDSLTSYLRFHIIDSYATTLTPELERLHFEFHDQTVSGIAQQEEPWKRGVQILDSALGEVVGQLYVEKHFKPEAKRRMSELVDNLKLAFEDRIGKLEWMGEGTKKQALEKLGMFTTKIGYPDKWRDYSKLPIADGPLAENMIAAAKFDYQRDLDKLGGPIDRNEWHMTPQTINAYYNPTMNEIVFPAAILQPPFFDLSADDAVNYGAIGAVIGHEISHGFDDKGSKFDGKGNLRKWWTLTDREEFERRASVLTEQYSQFAPFEDMNVNGELTLGENIGDLGGLSVSYAAYQLSLDGKEAPIIDGLTGDQRFFLGWSQIWRRLYREAELRKRLLTDPHSPSEYRVNGIVRNMDAWYDAFDVAPDDALYLAPEERVRIW